MIDRYVEFGTIRNADPIPINLQTTNKQHYIIIFISNPSFFYTKEIGINQSINNNKKEDAVKTKKGKATEWW